MNTDNNATNIPNDPKITDISNRLQSDQITTISSEDQSSKLANISSEDQSSLQDIANEHQSSREDISNEPQSNTPTYPSDQKTNSTISHQSSKLADVSNEDQSSSRTDIQHQSSRANIQHQSSSKLADVSNETQSNPQISSESGYIEPIQNATPSYVDMFQNLISNVWKNGSPTTQDDSAPQEETKPIQLQEQKDEKIISQEEENLEEKLDKAEQRREERILFKAVSSWGYPIEKHVVESEKWIIHMHRIKHGRLDSQQDQSSRPVVFLQHGLFNSSSAWLVPGPKYSLALLLADNGYDVWLGNNRANQFARKNKLFKKGDPLYWDWSFHHMGCNDLPQQVNYILQNTGQSNLTYIGHSQGTTQAFVGLSMYPELQSKINLFIALAPVTSMKHQKNSMLRFLASERTETLFKFLHGGEVGHRTLSRSFLFFPRIFSTQFRILSGLNGLWNYVMDCDLDKEILPLLTQLEPSPSGIPNLVHWSQLVRSGRFCRRDHGATINEKVYGQINPPEYPIESIRVPIALFYATEDLLSTPKDVESFLIPKIQENVVFQYCWERARHNDFVWGRHAPEVIHTKVLEIIRRQLSNHETNHTNVK